MSLVYNLSMNFVFVESKIAIRHWNFLYFWERMILDRWVNGIQLSTISLDGGEQTEIQKCFQRTQQYVNSEYEILQVILHWKLVAIIATLSIIG